MQIGETHVQSPMERKLMYFLTSFFFFFHSDRMAVAFKERIELLAPVRGILFYASDLLTHQTNSEFCSDKDGQDGVRGGREVQEGGNICIHIADSFHCTEEINTTF